MNAWLTLVRYQEQHGKVPSVDMFRRSYPEDAYKLPDSAYTAEELTSIFLEDRGSTLPGWPTRTSPTRTARASGTKRWS